MARVKLVMALVLVAMSFGGKWVAAQGHHVVGGDRGWEPSSDLVSWSSGRAYKVGDKLWFTYSAAQESVAEVKSKEEYESCDASNPIRLYTDGLDGISLLEEGIRYFVSSKQESCKNGLKLHVEVQPKESPEVPKVADSESEAVAAGPTLPSGSARLCGSFVLLLAGVWVYCVGVF